MLSEILEAHRLVEIKCLHDQYKDIAVCSCGWESKEQFTILSATCQWMEHVVGQSVS